MHIEPGIVAGAKIILSYATAAAAALGALRAGWIAASERGLPSLIGRSAIAAALTFSFFELLPHYPVGVSEVHLILGSTLFLLLGAGPAAIGLALGLLVQGMVFAPFDLPQYGMNLTTLLVPLYGLHLVARRIIARDTAYVDLTYGQVATLSFAYQGGIVGWVAFWAFYGQGFGAENLVAISSFGAAYMLVVLIEPLVDLAVLAGAKALRGSRAADLLAPRLYAAA